MKVSDKDFDQLFSAKLADMEMEPSANVWSNIADELDGKKKDEKAGLPFMKIAAGIVVLMAVGLLFLRPAHQKIQLTASVDRSATGTQSRIATVITSPESDEATVATATTQPVKVTRIAKVISSKSKGNTGAVVSDIYAPSHEDNTQNIPAIDVQPATNSGVIASADVNTKVISGSSNQVPDIKLSTQMVKNLPRDIAKNNVPVVANENTNTKITTEPTKKRKIHGLGDLLNVVIAKVDKREDKIIEFTNSSDDDSFNVTGVNLGLIKAKKEK